jgi:hypothetical protein
MRPELAEAPPDATLPGYGVPLRLRVAAIVLRSIFVCALLVITVRVSTPQNETIWTVFDSLGDAIRLVLGLVVCIWIIAHLFMLPKDAEGYRTWVYLGVALAPLALACAIAVW